VGTGAGRLPGRPQGGLSLRVPKHEEPERLVLMEARVACRPSQDKQGESKVQTDCVRCKKCQVQTVCQVQRAQ